MLLVHSKQVDSLKIGQSNQQNYHEMKVYHAEKKTKKI